MNLILPLVVANPDPYLIIGSSLDESNTATDTTTTIGSSQTKIYPSLILGMSLDESNTTATTSNQTQIYPYLTLD